MFGKYFLMRNINYKTPFPNYLNIKTQAGVITMCKLHHYFPHWLFDRV